MASPEIPLDGGNASSFVVRRGDTVRKPWATSTNSVQRLLEHLRARVGDLVPEPLGKDDHGRQVLEFVPGIEAIDELPLDAADLERVGASIRALHEAAASFPRNETDAWTTAMRRPGDELICHNDLAPWNLIRSPERWTFIDWDGAGPTTRIADLAYAARAFAQLDHDHELPDSLALLRTFLDGYAASADDRDALAPAMIERAEAMRDLLIGSITTGVEPWASMAVSGHGDYWMRAAAHLRGHAAEIQNGIR
ncbi:phosphotransferase [Planctomonas sp. JC2975]|uniref:phosphotransferase n=1 Tax=Planctomonas sp. JC2975 TaxID=2729626 RepID=UPI0014728413|nr:phosphotransferase [Planctomonas sp. JC2975]NNC13711.1 phosphotransferase [Planctomonas sp. JC2975]